MLRARLAKEAAATPRFAEGSEWRASHRTVADFHRWLNAEHMAYAPARLLPRGQSQDVDGNFSKLLQASYGAAL